MTDPKQNTKIPMEMPAFGLKLADIYYVLFRRKWIIAAFLGIGIIGALSAYFSQGRLYWSEAKLLVLYVIETKPMDPGVGTTIKDANFGGESVINSELEILTRFDICRDVAIALS